MHKKCFDFQFHESYCAASSNQKTVGSCQTCHLEMVSISRPLFLSPDFQELNVPLNKNWES